MVNAVNLVREGKMGYKNAAKFYNLKWQTVRDGCHSALETVYRTLDSLLTFFESRKAKDPKAARLSKKVGREMFILHCIRHDGLAPAHYATQPKLPTEGH